MGEVKGRGKKGSSIIPETDGSLVRQPKSQPSDATQAAAAGVQPSTRRVASVWVWVSPAAALPLPARLAAAVAASSQRILSHLTSPRPTLPASSSSAAAGEGPLLLLLLRRDPPNPSPVPARRDGSQIRRCRCDAPVASGGWVPPEAARDSRGQAPPPPPSRS
ncbi:hypothetical protein DAI22_12g094500 [Oryza sativa Japonica Group]|nr:hypothetical protein DAI22_12g094500 [Oryza sativa Japonica Group]